MAPVTGTTPPVAAGGCTNCTMMGGMMGGGVACTVAGAGRVLNEKYPALAAAPSTKTAAIFAAEPGCLETTVELVPCVRIPNYTRP